MKSLIILYCFLLFAYTIYAQMPTYASLPDSSHVLVVFNELDQTSIDVKAYYQTARGIPAVNIVALNLPDTIITINDTTHTVGLAQQTDIIRDFDQDLNSIA